MSKGDGSSSRDEQQSASPRYSKKNVKFENTNQDVTGMEADELQVHTEHQMTEDSPKRPKKGARAGQDKNAQSQSSNEESDAEVESRVESGMSGHSLDAEEEIGFADAPVNRKKAKRLTQTMESVEEKKLRAQLQMEQSK